MWVTDYKRHPYRGECLRFEKAPVKGPVREKPHFTYRVESFESAAKGLRTLLEPFDVGFALVGFYELEDGAVVDLMQIPRGGMKTEVGRMSRRLSDPYPDAGAQDGFSGYLEKHRTRAKASSGMKSGWSDILVDHGYQNMFDGFIDSMVKETRTPCDELAGYRATGSLGDEVDLAGQAAAGTSG